MTTAIATTEAHLVKTGIDWKQAKTGWADLLEKHECERALYLRALVDHGATQKQIGDQLGIKQSHVGRLLDYGQVLEKLTPTGVKSVPAERELRPYVEEAAAQIAEEHGVERVRKHREKVYSLAAEKYETETPVVRKAKSKQLGANDLYDTEAEDYLKKPGQRQHTLQWMINLLEQVEESCHPSVEELEPVRQLLHAACRTLATLKSGKPPVPVKLPKRFTNKSPIQLAESIVRVLMDIPRNDPDRACCLRRIEQWIEGNSASLQSQLVAQ